MNWIKCSERLPEVGERVLAWADGVNHKLSQDGCYTAVRQRRYWDVDAWDNYGAEDDFSHWMPLPEGPKEGSE
jgi:hypothetical protein